MARYHGVMAIVYFVTLNEREHFDITFYRIDCVVYINVY